MDARKKLLKYIIVSLIFTLSLSGNNSEIKVNDVNSGADLLVSELINIIENKKVGIITNHTGILSNGTHLVDTLFKNENVKIISLFGPEHGIRGFAPDGLTINDGIDSRTGLPVYSLYGKTKKPTQEMLDEIQILIFDIQDIGARFYTFISTMYNAIQAAAENNISIIILDRPNPIGGHIVNGPILKSEFKSFVGIAEIPIQHGMTVGELALYFNQEHILGTEKIANLEIIKMKNWERSNYFDQTNLPWIAPSPNMPTLETAIAYPGLCLLEGTNISEGRGTQSPFLQFGSPYIISKNVISELFKLGIEGCELFETEFTPTAIPNKSMHPKYLGEKCNGIKLQITDRNKFNSIEFGVKLIYVFNKLYPENFTFRDKWIDKLWGSDQLRKQILANVLPEIIVSNYSNELNIFKDLRKQFLLY